MNIKSIEKIKGIYERIKGLDAEITEIDKMAQLIADKETEINFSLAVKDYCEANEQKCEFDEDGSLKKSSDGITSWGSMFTLRLDGFAKEAKKDDSTMKLNYQLDDRVALIILNILITGKKQERSVLLSDLREYGFNI